MSIGSGLVILLSYVLGELMTMILPVKIFNLTINPGPFTTKEHVVVIIIATSAANTSDAIEALTIQRIYYNFYLNHFNAILFVIIMHLLAISIAGILKRYLVWPAAMIWPTILMSCSLIRALVNDDDFDDGKARWKMSRSKFFILVAIFHSLWQLIPSYIFPLLSFFSFVCMIAPHNIIFSQVTGANGLGLGAIELNWNAWVAYLGSPIVVPFW